MFDSLAKTLSCDLDVANLPVRAEQIRARLKSYPVMVAGQVLIAGLLVSMMWDKVSHSLLLIWAGVLLVELAVEAFHAWHYAYETRTLDECRLWRARMITFVIITGSIWGTGGVLLFVPDDLAYQALLICVYLGLAAGAATTNPVFPPALYIYISLLMLPLLMVNALVGDRVHIILAIMLTVYLAYVINAGRALAHTFELALRRTFENEQLVEQLTGEKSHAEQSDRMKSRFLAAASHDLRQPLHALNLFLAALKTHVSGARGNELHCKVEHSVEVLSSMLDILLDVSRLDAGVVQPNYQLFTIQSLLIRLKEEFLVLAQEKGLQLEVAECDKQVCSDPVLLECVLRNLISNAIHHSEQGTVSIYYKVIEQGLEVTVQDTGVGIAPENLPHIFEEYYQVGNQSRNRRKGLGLGLAIVKRLDRLLGYQLQVHSILGEGSRFVFIIPEREPVAVEI